MEFSNETSSSVNLIVDPLDRPNLPLDRDINQQPENYNV